MTGSMLHWSLILLAAGSNVVLNFSLKNTVRSLPRVNAPLDIGQALLLSPWLWLALFSGTLLIGSFMVAIRTFSLSVTYTAVTALAMVSLTAIGATLGEDVITPLRLLGLSLVIIGLVITAVAAP